MAARPIVGLVSFILLAGGLLLQFFVILSGAISSGPINQFYFLESTTNGISGARNPTRWTYFALTGVNTATGLDDNYGQVVAALPFDPQSNFASLTGVPQDFVGTNKFYYLSRFMFAFYLVALFFAAIAFLLSGLALCTRLGAYLAGALTALALFFQTLAAALQTSWVVLGRDIFNANGQTATIGQKSMGFAWGAMACFFLCTILYCIGGAAGRNKNTATGAAYDKSSHHRSSGGTFGRKPDAGRSSFERSSRIKDEYS